MLTKYLSLGIRPIFFLVSLIANTAMQRMLGFLKRNCAGILDSKDLKLLYLSLVRSHLSYCSQIWATQPIVKEIMLIESVQRRATRFICKNIEFSLIGRGCKS